MNHPLGYTLYTFLSLKISKPGSQAIIATVFGKYTIALIFGDLTKKDDDTFLLYEKFSSFLLIVYLTTINCFGVRESANLQNILTALKLLMVFSVVCIAVLHLCYDTQSLSDNLNPQNAFRYSHGFTGFFSAMVACLWAFDGWYAPTFMHECMNTITPMIFFFFFFYIHTILHSFTHP